MLAEADRIAESFCAPQSQLQARLQIEKATAPFSNSCDDAFVPSETISVEGHSAFEVIDAEVSRVYEL